MKNWDLYKVIIVLSLLLMPVAGYWWWTIEGRIDEGEKAIAREATSKGYLAQIGGMLSEWEVINQNEAKTRNIQDARLFFQKMILTASGGSINSDEFTLTPDEKIARGVKGATDVTVSIKFNLKDRKELPREYVSNLLRNVEGQAPVWRLNTLKMRNADFSASTAPPDEIRDDWEISRLEFVRRKGGS